MMKQAARLSVTMLGKGAAIACAPCLDPNRLRDSACGFIYVGVGMMVATALLAACGGGPRGIADKAVQNPYVERVKTLTGTGMAAMQRERWNYAGTVFERALNAAQLTDDPSLVAREWYNLGAAHAASGQYQKAWHDFNEARVTAEDAGDKAMTIRARLARSLLSGQEYGWRSDVLDAKYPADMHLAAARLAQKQGRQDVAKQEYYLVLRKTGKSRSGLLYRGQAHLALAMLAREAQDMTNAKKEVEESLGLLREAGSPRLVAHALLFYGKLEISHSSRRQSLERSLKIYRKLEDIRGQRACMIALEEM